MNNEPIDQTSRREFVKKLAYIAPAIVTLNVAPSFAKAGSGKGGKDDKDGKDGKDGKGG